MIFRPVVVVPVLLPHDPRDLALDALQVIHVSRRNRRRHTGRKENRFFVIVHSVIKSEEKIRPNPWFTHDIYRPEMGRISYYEL